MPHARAGAEIRAPIDRVFRYVTTPSHWPEWHLNSASVGADAAHSLECGEQLVEEFVIAWRRGMVTWTVADRVEPTRWMITGKVAGGGDGTILYSLASRGDSVTAFQRDFVYTMPNPFLRLMDRLYLHSRIAADARRSVERLKAVLEAQA